jgi:hypothetical protein
MEISTTAVLQLAELEQVLVVVVAEQVIHLSAQEHQPTMAVMVAQAVAVGAVLELVALLAQAVTALFIFTTKEF